MTEQLVLDLRVSPLKPECDYCGLPLPAQNVTSTGGLGGGVNEAGETLCYPCCAFADAIDLANTEPGEKCAIALYIFSDNHTVGNWPGSLSMTVLSIGQWKTGGFGSYRRTVLFRGPIGSTWAGTEYNGNAGSVLRNLKRLRDYL